MAGRTDDELWDALKRLSADPLRSETPISVVDSMLRAAGADPSELAAEGAAFAKAMQEEARLAWKSHAAAKLSAFRQTASTAAAKVTAILNRQQLLDRLVELKQDPSFGGTVVMAFRKRRPEDSTDEDLRSLLESVEELRAIATADKASDR
jgi:hypothetical protein